jgi:hypothetical protein
MKKILFSIFVGCLLISCGDDDPKPKTTEELLQGATKGWVATAATVNPPLLLGGTSITDLFSLLDDCDKDEVLIFSSATNYSAENPVKCEVAEPTILESGTWSLSSDKKTVRFVPTGFSPYEANLIEVTETSLRMSFLEVLNGVTYTATYTFKPRP